MRRGPRDAEELLGALHHALVPTARPNPFLALWRWRYELALGAAIPLLLTWLTSTGGADATVAITSVVTALLFGWPTARRRILARAWCVLTPHRFRLACAQARIHTRKGRLPAVMRCARKPYGEQLLVWCPAGITAADLHAARAVITAACFATDVEVVAYPTRRQLVMVAIIRRSKELHVSAHSTTNATGLWQHKETWATLRPSGQTGDAGSNSDPRITRTQARQGPDGPVSSGPAARSLSTLDVSPPMTEFRDGPGDKEAPQ